MLTTRKSEFQGFMEISSLSLDNSSTFSSEMCCRIFRAIWSAKRSFFLRSSSLSKWSIWYDFAKMGLTSG